MKKTLLVFLLIVLVSVCTSALAAEREIFCELENEDAVTYYVNHQSLPIHKTFVKYTDKNNNNSYWFRISNNSYNRFLYYMSIKFDGKEYILHEIQNPTYSQERSTTGHNAAISQNVYSLYAVPQNVINDLKNCKTPIIFIVNRQKKQGMVYDSDIEFTQAIQKIIGLSYSNKDEYWKPNTK